MNKVICVVCVFLICFCAKAQLADSLGEVQVHATRLDQFSTGVKTVTIDSVSSITYRTQALADLLSMQSQVFIKSYGPGLATSSFRGAGAAHTAVVWKGFNLQSAMHGEVDFNLINTDVIDKVAIQYGGNGALFGSGAVGGIIQLQSVNRFSSGLHASAGVQLGSFEHVRKQFSLSYGNQKWYTTVKWFTLDALNNFTYTNTSVINQPEMKLANARAQQTGFLNEHAFKLSHNQELNIAFWYNTANRQIPPTMSMVNQQAYQLDETYRATAEWKLQQHRVLWMLRSAYFDEQLNYKDPLNTYYNSYSHGKTNITEAEMRVSFNPVHQLNVGFNNTYTNAYSDGYGGSFSQNRSSVFVSYKLNEWIKNVVSTVSVRQEVVAQKLTPIIPSFGVEWKTTKWVKLYGNVSRTYRVPTFNEQFWITGTTNQLKPEQGWSEELSTALNTHVKKVTLALTATAFNRNMNNWIVWQPAGALWAPQNIKSVWSRGAELDGTVAVPFRKWQFKYHGAVNLVLSTNSETLLANDASIDKQLIYVPRVTQQHQFTAAFASFYVAYFHSYIGLRFTATDNSQWLDDYQLGSLAAGKTFTWKTYSLVLTAQVQNLYNKTYQAVADRPMPGRNYLFTLTIKI